MFLYPRDSSCGGQGLDEEIRPAAVLFTYQVSGIALARPAGKLLTDIEHGTSRLSVDEASRLKSL